jgi:hypothetical protein
MYNHGGIWGYTPTVMVFRDAMGAKSRANSLKVLK